MKGGSAGGGGSRVPGSELPGGATEGRWAERTRHVSTSIPAPAVHLSTPPGLLPRLPAPPHGPLSSGFFLCNLFFKKNLYYFFIRLQQLLLGGLGFYFSGGRGWGGHFVTLPQLSI